MRITTLGTSHGDPTATSFQSSILLETGGGFYLFDAGEPVSALLILPTLLRGRLSRPQGVALLAIYAAFCVGQFV